ncbi:MAG TPA: 2-phosphosulfolactate phosphatase [Pseudonocardiaceae bacterium]|nr:2-phosphosulfolactate phosphatase [Pseudonocardiaceae bacterium]
MIEATFAQDGYDIRFEWGTEGVDVLAGECGALVIVDVLSFSTSVDVAVARGARILPLPWRDERAAAAAKAAGAVLGGERSWSLRPASLLDIPAGTLLALPSPNGATLCTRAAATGTRVLAGCLRNARSVAGQALAAAGGRPVGVIAAGERWPSVDGRPLRPAVEDMLGAGAIVAAMRVLGGGTASAEAAVAASAALAVDDMAAMIAACSSGRELIGWDHPQDVELAGELDVSTAAPVLVDGVLSDVS